MLFWRKCTDKKGPLTIAGRIQRQMEAARKKSRARTDAADKARDELELMLGEVCAALLRHFLSFVLNQQVSVVVDAEAR